MGKLLRVFVAFITFHHPYLFAAAWAEIEQHAKGQTVYFHAWGGSSEVNNYIQWAAAQLKAQHQVTLKHVKVTDITETTVRLLAEKSADKHHHGSVDLLWINGENFKSLKDNHLLFGPFVQQLPHWALVDQSLPVEVDFSVPTEGLEAPWGLSQLVFIHDKNMLTSPPTSFIDLLNYSKATPYRFTYPQPPEFHGSSFLKALLIAMTHHHPALAKPVTDADYTAITQPLWQYLDEFHHYAWRKGRQFPAGSAETLQLLDDKQIDLAITFNPNAVYAAQNIGLLAPSTQAYAFESGALSNIHFLAIPWNATAKAGAQVVINFLLSPAAQSRKGDLQIWGDMSVLQRQYLTGDAAHTPHFRSLNEPHPSWQTAIENEWLSRYGS